jgi:hypothetical protein
LMLPNSRTVGQQVVCHDLTGTDSGGGKKTANDIRGLSEQGRLECR